MKAHLTKLSVALLSTAFLLGCQDQGSGPVGPEVAPQFNRPTNGVHNHGGDNGPPPPEEGGSFTATYAGDVSGVFSLGGPQSGKLILNSPNAPDPVTLSGPLLDLRCFSNPPFDALAGVDESGRMQMFFTAEGTDGSEVKYVLAIFGALEDGAPWPPTLAVSNEITGGTFTLEKGNGPGKKVACEGSGILDFTAVVEVAPN